MHIKTYRHVRVKRYVDIIVPTDASLEDLIEIIGGCYGNLFISTEAKKRAWNQYRLWCHENDIATNYSTVSEDEYLDSFIQFLHSSPKPDFIKFLAKSEHMEPEQYFLSRVSP